MFADRGGWVQCVERVLKDRLDAEAECSQSIRRQQLALKRDLARLWRCQPEQKLRDRAFAAAGLPDQPMGFTLTDAHADVAQPRAAKDLRSGAARSPVTKIDIAKFEDRFRGRPRCTKSRRPDWRGHFMPPSCGMPPAVVECPASRASCVGAGPVFRSTEMRNGSRLGAE